MKKDILFPLALLILFNSNCSHIESFSSKLQTFGINPNENSLAKIIVINDNDCFNCLHPVYSFFDLANEKKNNAEFYVVLANIRESKINKIISDFKINLKKNKVIQSDQLVNILTDKANINEFTSFILVYDFKKDKIVDMGFFKKLNSQDEFNKFILE